MNQQQPPIRDFFRLDELLTPEDLKRYSKDVAGLTFLNLGFEKIWQDPRAPELCEAVAETVWGERGCRSCTIQANPPRTTEATETVCVAGVHTTFAAIMVQGKAIGYVSGPQHPSAELYERDLTVFPAATRAWLEKQRLGLSEDRKAIVDAVGRVARRVSRRCALERRLRILRDARTRCVAAQDPEEVLELTFRSLEALFGHVDICFYVLEESGFLKLISARGPSEEAMPASLKPEEGHIGRVTHSHEPFYQPDLDQDQEFIHADTVNRVRSAFTVPLPWFADEAHGALQAASRSKDHFALPDRQAMQAIAEVAGLAAVKLFLKAKVAAARSPAAAETWASIGLAEMAKTTDRPAEILQAKSRLFRALADEASRVSRARAACVGVLDARHNAVRVAASTGEGWTEETKSKLSRPNEPNAVMFAIKREYPLDVPDTKKEQRFKTILPFTRSLYIVPFSLKTKTIGVLSLSASYRHGFKDDVKTAIRHLVEQFEDILPAVESREDALFKRLSTDTDLGLLTRDAVDVIRRAFHVRSCSLFLKDRDADRVELCATTEPMPDYVHAYDYGEGLTGWIAQTKRSLRLHDTNDTEELDAISPGLRPKADKAWRETIAGGDTNRAFLAVPLIAGERVIGVVRLKVKDDLSDFTHEEETSLLNVADRLAATIDNVRLTEETAAKLRQLESQAEFQRQLTQAEGLQATCQTLAEQFMRDTGALAAEILIVDGTPGYEIRLPVTAGWLKGLTADNTRAGDAALGVLPRRTKSLFDDHVRERSEWRAIIAPVEERFRGSPLARIVSAATIPVVLDDADDIFAVLLLCWNTPQNFDENGGRHIDDLVRPGLTALLRPILRRHIDVDLEHRVTELSRLHEIGLGFAQTHDLDVLMREILRVSLDESKMERGSIRFFNEATSTLERKAVFPAPLESVPATLRVNELLKRSIDSERCVFVSNMSAPEPCMEAIRSCIHVPIRLHGKCIGLILLDSSREQTVGRQVLEFLEIVGLYAAVAIDFAQKIELAEPLAMMGTMLHGFLHVIRNRINDLFAILGNISESSPASHVRRKADDMRDQLLRLQHVCNDLAHFTRSDPTSVNEHFALNDLVERMLGDFSSRLREREIVVEKRLCDPSPVLIGNPIQIEIAFKMLVQNAIEAMEQGGRLTVETVGDPSAARVSFRDTGEGMDALTKSQCMQPFFTTKRDHGGTGLGLSVVFGIMTRHRGRVDIQSAPGAGSTFTLFFPMQEERSSC